MIQVLPMRVEESGPTRANHTEYLAQWLAKFDVALRYGKRIAVASSFADECYWHDLLALTWNITPYGGAGLIAEALTRAKEETKAGNFHFALHHTPPRQLKRLGIDVDRGLRQFRVVATRLPRETRTVLVGAICKVGQDRQHRAVLRNNLLSPSLSSVVGGNHGPKHYHAS
jgi:hypothetical protein